MAEDKKTTGKKPAKPKAAASKASASKPKAGSSSQKPSVPAKATAKAQKKESADKTQRKPENKVVPILSRLRPAPGAVREKKRKGRGVGSGLGKTSGRGQKGQKARSTGAIGKLYFEGGQMPLQRRLPKVGFFNPFARSVAIVNVRDLTKFDKGAVVDVAALRARGIIRTKSASEGEIKILAKGELDRALTVHAHAFSEEAKKKIEAAGGKVVVLERRIPAPIKRAKKSA
jgi:large subunit ribosomal protein L15